MSEMRSADETGDDEGDIMFKMLPTDAPVTVSLAEIVPSCLNSLGWQNIPASLSIPSARATVLILVDGLGSENLLAAHAYARFLSSGQAQRSGRTVFPSTTATALSSLASGRNPGEHGVLGYRILDGETNELVNQLSGLSSYAVENGWMSEPSLFSRAAVAGRAVTVVGHSRFEASTLSAMLYGNSRYVGARTISERFERVSQELARGYSGLLFVYISDLDEAAHSHGCASSLWLERLEGLDSEVKELVTQVGPDVNVLLTADHGIIDVPSANHLNYPDELLQGVAHVGGEPRCLQLYLEDESSSDDVRHRWSEFFGETVEIWSRDEIFATHYDSVKSTSGIAQRAGDLYVQAGQDGALYPANDMSLPGRNMIGQHGGNTSAEMAIPVMAWRDGKAI
jgi:predicted AlkP superfamily pyrophosphatase or phosphodiesterase